MFLEHLLTPLIPSSWEPGHYSQFLLEVWHQKVGIILCGVSKNVVCIIQYSIVPFWIGWYIHPMIVMLFCQQLLSWMVGLQSPKGFTQDADLHVGHSTNYFSSGILTKFCLWFQSWPCTVTGWDIWGGLGHSGSGKLWRGTTQLQLKDSIMKHQLIFQIIAPTLWERLVWVNQYKFSVTIRSFSVLKVLRHFST